MLSVIDHWTEVQSNNNLRSYQTRPDQMPPRCNSLCYWLSTLTHYTDSYHICRSDKLYSYISSSSETLWYFSVLTFLIFELNFKYLLIYLKHYTYRASSLYSEHDLPEYLVQFFTLKSLSFHNMRKAIFRYS